MRALRIMAGPGAMSTLQKNGFTEDQFSAVLGASGGPKWFILGALDQYLLNEFFVNRSESLQLIGSSAGAWRFACWARAQPAAAVSAFLHGYQHLEYPPRASIDTITAISSELLKVVAPDERSINEILTNPIMKLNFIVTLCMGLTASENRLKLLTGLVCSALANAVSRRHLAHFYQRLVFQADTHKAIIGRDDIPTGHDELSVENFQSALLASGSIPLALRGIRNTGGFWGPDALRDGGIIDYHFDVRIKTAGLVLYPHFYPYIVPGWFDKKLRRSAQPKHYHNTVMLVPSDELIASLPFAKIADRKDFRMDQAARVAYWQQVIDAGQHMAEEFNELLYNERWQQRLEPLSLQR